MLRYVTLTVVNLTDTSQCIQPLYSLQQVPNLLLHYRGGSGGSLPPAPPPRYVSLTVVNLTNTSQCIQFLFEGESPYKTLGGIEN